MIEASPTREQLQDYKFFNVEEFFRVVNNERDLLESMRRLQKTLDAIQERSVDTWVYFSIMKSTTILSNALLF